MAEGKELILTSVAGAGGYGYNQIFVAGGTNPIPSEVWDAYVADFGYTKNSNRTAVFGGYEVLSSPGYPTGNFVYYTDTQGYTWLWNTQNRMAIYPFDQSEYPNLTTYQAGQTGSATPRIPAGICQLEKSTNDIQCRWHDATFYNGQIRQYFHFGSI